MTDKQQKANIVCCETCSHREVCYEVITNTDYDFKGYGCLRYCVSPLVISNNARKETAKEFADKLKAYIDNNKHQSHFFGTMCLIDKETINEIAKQYGVEVEE